MTKPTVPTVPTVIREVPTIDELVEALRLHRAEIVEADEWRPLAKHVHDLIEAIIRSMY